MRIRLHKNWTPVTDAYQLTKNEIEFQVMEDMRKFRELYSKKHGKSPEEKIDVDNFVELLWGFQIVFMEIQPKGEDEVWGYLDPQNKLVYVNPNCSQERTNFTVAHEAGHLALHVSLMRLENGVVTGWRDKPISPQLKNTTKLNATEKRLEWQANKYASSLLVPKTDLIVFLTGLGYVKNGAFSGTFDMQKDYLKIKDRFGISKKAFEIRLSDLNIPFTNSNIGNTKKLL